MIEAFLGGTCNESTWRDELIPMLDIDVFNPVVPDWNEEAYQLELVKRDTCDFCVYVLTPLMTGTYSIAETVDDSNKRPEKTVFCFLTEDGGEVFDEFQVKSLTKVAEMVAGNGATVRFNLEQVADFLNNA